MILVQTGTTVHGGDLSVEMRVSNAGADCILEVTPTAILVEILMIFVPVGNVMMILSLGAVCMVSLIILSSCNINLTGRFVCNRGQMVGPVARRENRCTCTTSSICIFVLKTVCMHIRFRVVMLGVEVVVVVVSIPGVAVVRRGVEVAFINHTVVVRAVVIDGIDRK